MFTKQLAEFAVNLKCESLPEQVITKAKSCLIDNFAAILAASNERSIKILKDTLLNLNHKQNSRLLPGQELVSTIIAGTIHAAMAQATEIDDFYKPALLHIGSTCIPPALALAMEKGISGKKLIAALVAAYEVGTRIGASVNPGHHQIWHTTGTVGTFAACVSVGKVLELNLEQMIYALGTAGTQASGLNQYMIDGGEMSKPLHSGKAAYNGYIAAELAGRGFTGATKIIEGPKGFARATSKDFNPAKLKIGEGQFNIMDITQRLYPVNGHILSAVQAIISLISEHPEIESKQVKEINVAFYNEAVNFLEPVKATTPFLARFCLPYCLATAVINRKLDNSLFTEDALKDSSVRHLMSKIRMYEDKKLTAQFPAIWSSRITIKINTNHQYTKEIKIAKGDPENSISLQEIIAKAEKIACLVLEKELVGRILSRYAILEKIEDLSELWQ